LAVLLVDCLPEPPSERERCYSDPDCDILIAITRHDAGVALGTSGTGSPVVAAEMQLAEGAVPSEAGEPSEFKLVSYAPAAGEALIDVSGPITVTLSASIDRESVNSSTLRVTRNGREVAGVLAVEGDSLAFAPHKPWVLSARYRVHLSSDIRDLQHRSLTPTSFEFSIRAGRWSRAQLARSDNEVASLPRVLLSPSGHGVLSFYRAEAHANSDPKSWPLDVAFLDRNGRWAISQELGLGERRGFAINDAGRVALVRAQGDSFELAQFTDRWASIPITSAPEAALKFVSDAHWSADDRLTLLGYEIDEATLVRSLAIGRASLHETVLSAEGIDGSARAKDEQIANLKDGPLVVWTNEHDAVLASTCARCGARTLTAAHVKARGKPSVAVDSLGRSAVVLWEQASVSWTSLWATRIVSGGQWTQPVPIADGRGEVRDARVQMDERGMAIAVWLQTDGSAVQVLSAVLDPGTGTWSSPQALSPAADTVSVAPTLAIEPRGNAIAMWLQQHGHDAEAKSEVHWARYIAGVGWFSETSVLSAAEVKARDVSLAMDSRGRASAAWTENGELWVARYD